MFVGPVDPHHLMVQACGSSYEVSDEEVEEGEVDKLVQSVLRLAMEVLYRRC